MPCNMLLVQAAKLEISEPVLRAIFQSETARDALNSMIKAQTDSYMNAYPSSGYLRLNAYTDHGYIELHVRLDGTIQANTNSLSRGFAGKYVEACQVALQQIAVYTMQSMIAQALAPVIVDDQRVNNARILTVNI